MTATKNKHKPSYDTRRQILGEIYPLSAPFTVILDSSEACNFRCNYCFRSTSDTEAWGEYTVKKELMNWEIFTKAIDQIKDFPVEVRHISLSHQGEPLINKNLPNMVKYIKTQNMKCRVSIHTNASLLDSEYAYELAKSGIDKIVVSIQGLTEEKYSEICRTKIDFSRLCQSLEILFRNKLPNTVINIKTVDTAVENPDEFFNLFSPYADAVFIEKIVPIWKNVGEGVFPEMMMNKYGEKFDYQKCCPLLFNTIVVVPNGDVYPCTQILSKECLGNINTSSLLEMWNGEKRKKLLIRQLQLSPPESCNGCYIRQNSIFSKEDMIDDYRLEILERLK